MGIKQGLGTRRGGVLVGICLGMLATMPGLGAVDLLYPDLVSDWGEYDEAPSGVDVATVHPAEEINWNGTDMLVVRFDGFVTNIGSGPLRIAGDPQTDSVYQWLLEAGGDPTRPDDYRPGPRVTLLYETDDGHDHWHLKNAQEYSLWTADHSAQVTTGSKVGFCLYDIGRIWPDADERYYGGSVVEFCDQKSPGSTSVEMGITPGWKDIYRADVNQQWIDVSAVAPGEYALATATDTSDQIVEEREDNNGVAFHPDLVTVPGYLPSAAAATTSAGASVRVDLPVTTFGSPGAIGFELVDRPTGGDVTISSDGAATYTPHAGFTGTDAFTFGAHDTTSAYPTERPTAVVTIQVAAATTPPPAPPPAPAPAPPPTTAPAPVPAPEDTVFVDVPSGHPFADAIAWMAEAGITQGCETERFCPEDPVTRGQIASFLVRAFELPTSAEDRFADDTGSTHEADINALAAAEITTGCAASSFCPTAAVTREQWASLFVRTVFGPGTTSASNGFDDDDGSVHEGAIDVLWDHSLTTGCGVRRYCPTAEITRGQLAAFLHRWFVGA